MAAVGAVVDAVPGTGTETEAEDQEVVEAGVGLRRLGAWLRQGLKLCDWGCRWG